MREHTELDRTFSATVRSLLGNQQHRANTRRDDGEGKLEESSSNILRLEHLIYSPSYTLLLMQSKTLQLLCNQARSFGSVWLAYVI